MFLLPAGERERESLTMQSPGGACANGGRADRPAVIAEQSTQQSFGEVEVRGGLADGQPLRVAPAAVSLIVRGT